MGDHRRYKECETLSPHAQIAITYSNSSSAGDLQRATILHNLARFDGEQSQYGLVEERYLKVVAIREKVLGTSAPDTLKSMS